MFGASKDYICSVQVNVRFVLCKYDLEMFSASKDKVYLVQIRFGHVQCKQR